jgi:hypothetical protein
MQIPKRSKILIALSTPVALMVVAFLGLHFLNAQPKTEIKEQTAAPSLDQGTVTGQNRSQSAGTLATTAELQYESPVVQTNQPKTNVVNLQWDQTGQMGEQAVEPQVRIYDGSKWTDWTEIGGVDDRKDGTPAAAQSGLVLTSNAQQVQYRFHLKGSGQEVAVSNPHLNFIDSTQGPDPTAPKSGLAKLLNAPTAKASVGSPRIISRAEWGCPEATSSPRWTPNYYGPLGRVMVHHTVTAGNPSNSAAEVRGVWYTHANSNGWGDIGYNYLVDKAGNIFQGRFYNQADADAQHAEVEGGHTYGFNDYSIGIAALGTYSSTGPTGQLLDGIGHIAGYKMAPYNLAPWSTYVDEGVPSPTPDGTSPRGGRGQYRIGGHRDYLSTECPGNALYPYLGQIRDTATNYFNYYVVGRQYDYSYVGQKINGTSAASVNLRNGQTATFSVDVKNEGENTWSNTGSTPVRLGTANPLGHNSSLAHSSWLAPNRPATFTQKVVNGTPQSTSTIAPGEIARFTFTVQAPNATATIYPYYQLIAENYAWFPRNVGIYFTVNLQADTYAAQWLDQSYNVPTVAGQQGTLNLTLKNNSTATWTNTGDANTIRLGTDRPKDHQSALYDPSWISQTRIATFKGKAQLDGSGNVVKSGGVVQYDNTATSVAPGEAAYFEFTVKAPTNTVHGNDYISPVVDGKAWMDNLGIYWPVNINAGYHAAFAGQSAAPVIDKSDGGSGVMYFDYKNDGSIAWVQSGSNPIRLGTDNPKDRNSGFRASNFGSGGNPALPTNTTNWLAANRVQTFAGTVSGGVLNTSDTVVDPGETGRFMIALDGRTIPNGTYPEYFSPVVEGIGWLFFGTYLPITVQS